MKKKNRKRHKHRQSKRRAAPAVHARQRDTLKHTKIETPSKPWLRIIANGIEDDPDTKFSRGTVSLRNGRRHSPLLDLYIPEEYL
jgi:hypothetical protein